MIKHDTGTLNTESFTSDISIQKNLTANPLGIKSHNTKPPLIYVHGKINHIKLLDAFKEYKNAFRVKFT